jgi:translocation and assembly module TamA
MLPHCFSLRAPLGVRSRLLSAIASRYCSPYDKIKMKKKSVHLLLTILLFQVLQSERASAFGRKRSAYSPCERVKILRFDDLNLTPAEIRLLCGDTDAGREGKAWKDIPPAQARKSFENFLQDRGYLSPTFRPIENGITEFDPGKITRITHVSGIGIPNDLKIGDYRGGHGEPMTPQLISRMSEWLKRRLQEAGYPCPEIEARAYPDTGEVVLEWKNPGPKARISGLREDSSVGPLLNAVRRYDAFELGGPYSLVLAQITEQRSSNAHLTFSHSLTPECSAVPATPSPPETRLTESVQMGAPRTVTFGISANSEVGPDAHASWAHTRLGVSGSSAELSVQGSLREQVGIAKANWYYLQASSRQYISPLIQFSNQNEPRFQLLAFRSQALWETGTEVSSGSWNFGAGPAWQNLQQLEGVGPLNSQFLSVKTEISYLSHEFEYRASSPRDGFRVSVSSVYVPRSIVGAGQPLSLSIQGTWLTYPGHSDPPWVIFGVRGRAFSTFVPADTSVQNIPVDFRQWLGGGESVRGFGLQEIPDQAFGALQGMSLSTELRVPGVLPLKLEPLFLLDGALTRSGVDTFNEQTQTFWSPGFGLRDETPVGTLRTTLAHGFEVGAPHSVVSHWQAYLSLGEEF